MEKQSSSIWQQAISSGVIAGFVALLIALVGMVEAFGETYIVQGLITLGDILLLAPIFLLTYVTIRRANTRSPAALFGISAAIGAIAGAILTLLILLGHAVDMRPMFINASPTLFSILMRGWQLPLGVIMPPLQGLIAGVLSFVVFVIPQRPRSAAIQGVLWVILFGTLRDQILLARIFQIASVSSFLKAYIFAESGLTLVGVLVVFVLGGGLAYGSASLKKVTSVNRTPEQQRKARWIQLISIAVFLLLLPPILGLFFSEVLDNSGLYLLMGLGLNIVIGFAGLLDLGYVAFYAIGAYMMGVLTSPELGFFHLTFFQALPIALLISFMAGLLLGLPVLRMRGDYLAIVTLGFGEIVRLLALSDWLKPWLGGTQGIQRIAQPQIGPLKIDTLQGLYYLILIGIAIVAFIATRLKDSRLGRSWMAIREDEDVAQAMGINLVLTKLMAFATGALFAGLAGTLGAAKLTSVYPHSMTFIVSINVLSLIIIGGMGSIPGVFVGALVLLSLPGVLTEFEEFRWWFYGAALVIMMLTRPEGLWPEARRRLELHEEADIVAE